MVSDFSNKLASILKLFEISLNSVRKHRMQKKHQNTMNCSFVGYKLLLRIMDGHPNRHQFCLAI